MFQKTLTFDDISIIPQYSEIESRKTIDISNKLGDFYLDLPIIASPMKDISEETMCITMAKNGALGILHRFCSIDRQQEMGKRINKESVIFGAAIGVSGDFFERFETMIEIGAKIICIDVACGNHILVKKALEKIKGYSKIDHIHLMARQRCRAEKALLI